MNGGKRTLIIPGAATALLAMSAEAAQVGQLLCGLAWDLGRLQEENLRLRRAVSLVDDLADGREDNAPPMEWWHRLYDALGDVDDLYGAVDSHARVASREVKP